VIERRIGGTVLRARCEERHEPLVPAVLAAFAGVQPLEPGSELCFGFSPLRLQADGDALLVTEPDYRAWPQRGRRETIDVTLEVLAAQSRLLHAVGCDADDVHCDQALLAAPGALEEHGLFLRRAGAVSAGDSGWLAGTLDDPDALARSEALAAVELASLVTRRPVVLQALTLPRGFVAIFVGDALAQVLDASDAERLQAPVVRG
jgi:hypothetical protein